MTIITNPDHIESLRVFTVRAALGLEIRTGMRRSSRGRTTLQLANAILGTSHRTNKAAYAALNEYIVDNGGVDRPLR